MILVLPDDFTGAAEIAGIANRFGLDTELRIDDFSESAADALVVDTNTRSCSSDLADKKLQQILSDLKMNPDWIFKKTDSVLRGHVRNEILQIMKRHSRGVCLLLPANPAKNRTISNGQYYINGTMLNHTAFAIDPEYPAKTADVLMLLGESPDVAMSVKKNGQPFHQNGIVVCEAENSNNVQNWAGEWQENMLAAGGAEFFESLLRKNGFFENSKIQEKNLPQNKTKICV